MEKAGKLMISNVISSVLLKSKVWNKVLLQKIFIITIYIIIFWIALPFFLLTLGFRLDYLLSISSGEFVIPKLLGWILFIIGSIIMSFAIGQLKFQGKGFPISHLPPLNLIEKGVYRYFRHPIYIGYTLSFAGISIILKSIMCLTFSTPLLILGWICYALFYEESVLIERFGKTYIEYKNNVPLIFPRKIMNSIKNALVSLGLFLNPIINKFANKTILFKAGNSIFVTEGLLVGIGTLFATQYLFLLLLLHGIKSQNAVILIYGLFLSSALCSRLFWWVGHFKEIKNQNALGIMNVGYVSWGGILGLIIFSFAFSFYFPYNFFLITDLIFRAIFIAYALGRLGCLTYGCCYGIKSNSFGINYNNVQSKAIRENGNVGFLRHPTQIYLFLNGCFLFITLNLFSLLNPPPGLTTAIAFLIYPIGRTYIEFFRDRKRLLKNIITEGHLGCISMFFLGWLLIFIIPFKFIDYPTEIWKIINLESNISLIPFSILIALFAFIVMGYHKGKVGTW